MARRGRKPKSQDQKLRDALERTQPAQHILDRRKLFSGIVQPPPKDRLEGRSGEIDSEVCDAIGQLCALGYFSGHGHDEIEMRDKGRFWGGHYALLMKRHGLKVGSFERRSPSTRFVDALSAADLMFDRMDENLPDYERQVLLTLIVDPLIGTYPDGEFPHWAKALIDEGLRQRGRFVRCGSFPNAGDYGILAAAVRGLCVLVDGALPSRELQSRMAA